MVKSMVPRIIPRKEHGISRKQVSPNAVRTLYRLHTRGFIAYLVGGCVRDLLLGKTPKDFDIATNATPGQIKRLFRNSRIIGRRFKLAHLHFQDEILEVSTFRREALPTDNFEVEEIDGKPRPPRHMKNEDGMVLRDNIFGTPEEDALRRDFTINALAYNIADFSVIDYSTGLADLEQSLIRPIGDPQVRFTEDPIRMLRAIRFAASHDFAIEPLAWKTICELSHTIIRVPPSRLYEEMQKLMLLSSVKSVFSLLHKSGTLDALFPTLTQYISENSDRWALLQKNLESLEELYRCETTPSPALFLAAIYGPLIEEEALTLHREGVPHQQAMDIKCSEFTEEIRKTLCVPGRVSGRLHDILSLQPSLHRLPPKRPAATASRSGFKDALVYLNLAAQTREELQNSQKWWENYIEKNPEQAISPETPADAPPPRKRRKRRRKHKNPPTTPRQKANTTDN